MCLKPRIESLPEEVCLNTDPLEDHCNYMDINDTSESDTTKKDLTCLQWDIRGLISEQADISNFLFDYLGKNKVDIVIISETG